MCDHSWTFAAFAGSSSGTATWHSVYKYLDSFKPIKFVICVCIAATGDWESTSIESNSKMTSWDSTEEINASDAVIVASAHYHLTPCIHLSPQLTSSSRRRKQNALLLQRKHHGSASESVSRSNPHSDPEYMALKRYFTILDRIAMPNVIMPEP